jgi:hypothetical protein
MLQRNRLTNVLNARGAGPALNVLAALCALVARISLAQPTRTESISFQGALKGTNGQPLIGGEYSLTFNFYDAATNGVAFATSTVSNVTILNGVASTPVPVDSVWFSGQTCYVSVAVNGGEDLVPRLLITSVPYAINAESLGPSIYTDSAGNLGIGTRHPQRNVHVVRSTSSASLALDGHDDDSDSSRNVAGLMFYRDGIERGGVFWNNDDTLRLFAQPGNRFDCLLIDAAGEVGIGGIAHGSKLNVEGTTRTHILQITGGADLAEHLHVTPHVQFRVSPGMVVSIDPTANRKFKLSDEPYDRKRVGVISGGNGVNPGLILTDESNSQVGGDHPIALVGQVWCYADADFGSIIPGDLLTTSSTPGHAMKATEIERSHFAILGQALTGLRAGRGFVQMLVQKE